MEYGLIGGKLGHSYSKTIHELLCGYSYELCPLPTEADARAFLQRRQFKAINVTIPYKKLVMEYCSFIDPRARAIGAVNTVVRWAWIESFSRWWIGRAARSVFDILNDCSTCHRSW